MTHFIVAIVMAALFVPVVSVEPVIAGPTLESRGRVPAIVARNVRAIVSITTRHIEHGQFNQAMPTRGLGSGILVDRRGYVLTNNHVVDGADDIKVTLTDGRTFRGTLVGTDRFSDLAVVKIQGDNLPTITLGDSAQLVVGEPVIAIGNPLWLEGGPTVTVGVVSALGRSMEEPGLPVLHNLIQTDAAINPGNSGGALLNLDGQVVGINTAIIASAHGIGFAIASNTAKPVFRALIKEGRIVRPSLGIDAVTVTPQVAYANDLAIEQGALLTRGATDGPAGRAGVMEGDVIAAVGGRRVRGVHELHAALAGQRIGDTVAIAVWRRGDAITVQAVLEEYR